MDWNATHYTSDWTGVSDLARYSILLFVLTASRLDATILSWESIGDWWGMRVNMDSDECSAVDTFVHLEIRAVFAVV